MEAREMTGRIRKWPASWRQRGVTLIELMVVMVVVGILVAIAYPAYQSQIQQTRRADAKSALLNAAQQLERCFTRYHSYNDAGCTVATSIAGGTMLSSDQWYLITDDGAGAWGQYRLVATPQGAQADDTRCANLRLTDRGVRDATGTVPNRCW
jgi:type IV pilus assembly protein PilE